MNFAKRTLMVVGVVTLAVLIVAVIAPNTAHGLVAALVQVTNTTANPVPITSVDLSNPIAIDQHCNLDIKSGLCSPESGPGSSHMYTVPAGKNLSLDSVGGMCEIFDSTGAKPTFYYAELVLNTHPLFLNPQYQDVVVDDGKGEAVTTYSFSQSLTAYLPATGVLDFSAALSPGVYKDSSGRTVSGVFYSTLNPPMDQFPGRAGCDVTFFGHLLNQ